jgi:penicillin-binding protein 2B
MAVAVPYEPGSTFKVVTLAGAVEDGKFNPNDTYMSGSIQITDQTLHDHDRNGWGRITFLEGLKRSSNVAFVKLGYEMLGQDKLLGYIKKFGFGSKTNIDVPMEAEGSIPMKYPAEFATATYGQGLTVTAIQQLASYGVVANGGKLMWPHVIKDYANHKTGEIIKKFEPKVVSQVISEQTAKQVTEYLEQVVSDQKIGTGKNAYIDGYRVAGKTGTAQKVVSGGKYSKDTYVISFAGYAPVEDPKILVVIIADEPDLGGDYKLGGQVAAPAFKDIVSQSLQYMGVGFSKGRLEVKQEQAASAIKAPDLSGMTPSDAKNIVVGSNGHVEVLGKGSKIIDQFPKAGAEMSEGQQIYALLQPQEELSMPDLKGKSLRAAMEMCAFVGVSCTTSGEGYVAEQSVAGAGSNRVVSLTLKPIGKVTESTGTPIPSASPESDKAAVKPNNG